MMSPFELAAIAGAAILLFGAERLPKLARSAGEMRREFIRGQQDAENETVTGETTASVTPAATTGNGAVATAAGSTTTEATDHEQRPAV